MADQQPNLQQIITGLQKTVESIANLAKFLRFSINNIRAGTILGNPTNAAGPLKRISLGSNLSFSGTTLEVDPAFSARVAALEAAEVWQAYVPTITAQAGAFTTVTLNFARFKRAARSIVAHVDFTIVSKGTAANYIIVTLPVASINGIWAAAGSEFDVNGLAISARIYTANPGRMNLLNYNNTDPIVDGGHYAVTIEYEIAP